MTTNAIEIEGLVKTYSVRGNQPPKQALKGIDLTIPAGSVFGLLGPTGAGKSTMINILAGLVNKTSGTVRIQGYDQDLEMRAARRAIGVMPQELNLDPFFSPRGALEVQAGLYGIPQYRRNTDAILHMIGLSDQAEAYARNLSGGMRRRLLLGKALVHSPSILVLDEPTAGVDIELRQMLWRNIRELNQKGTTVILTTHYLEEAEEMCDEIAIMNRGELLICEKTSDLIGRIDRKTLVITVDNPEIRIDLPPTVSEDRRKDGTIALSYRMSEVPAGAVLQAVGAAGLGIRDIRTEEPDLEEAFLALTRDKATTP